MSPRSLLSFHDVLSSQLDDSLSYHTLKRLLRALKSSSDLPYPTSSRTAAVRDPFLDSQLSLPLTLSCSAPALSPPPSSIPTLPATTPRTRFQHLLDSQRTDREHSHNTHGAEVGGHSKVEADPEADPDEEHTTSRLRRKRRRSKRSRLPDSPVPTRALNVKLFATTPDKDDEDEVEGVDGDDEKEKAEKVLQPFMKDGRSNGTSKMKRLRFDNVHSTNKEKENSMNVEQSSAKETVTGQRNNGASRVKVLRFEEKKEETGQKRNAQDKISMSNAKEAGYHLNKLLHGLAVRCPQDGVVHWSELRDSVTKPLHHSQRGTETSIVRFCSFVDSIFAVEDPLAAGPTSNAPKSSACVFYSDCFWEKTWTDFVAVVDAITS